MLVWAFDLAMVPVFMVPLVVLDLLVISGDGGFEARQGERKLSFWCSPAGLKKWKKRGAKVKDTFGLDN